MDIKVYEKPNHSWFLIPWLHVKMQFQSPHVYVEIWPFIAVFNHRNKADNKVRHTFGLVLVDVISFRSQNKINLNLGLCSLQPMDFKMMTTPFGKTSTFSTLKKKTNNWEKMSKTQVQILRYSSSHSNQSSATGSFLALYTLDTPRLRNTDICFYS